MKAIRWAAVTATALMSLLNLPGAFDRELTTPHWATRLATGVGVAGLVAAFGLARRLPWGRPAVLATGVVNLAGAIAALAAGWEGGATGLGISLVILVLGWFSQPAPAPEPAYR
jgi:hypothetical protein